MPTLASHLMTLAEEINHQKCRLKDQYRALVDLRPVTAVVVVTAAVMSVVETSREPTVQGLAVGSVAKQVAFVVVVMAGGDAVV